MTTSLLLRRKTNAHMKNLELSELKARLLYKSIGQKYI